MREYNYVFSGMDHMFNQYNRRQPSQGGSARESRAKARNQKRMSLVRAAQIALINLIMK